MSQTTRRITVSGRPVLLVGTAHISPESIAEVSSLVANEHPASVCVEIDDARYRSMTEGSRWENLDIAKVLREGRGFLLIANLALAGFQRRMGAAVGVKPGEEMLAAVRIAGELGIPARFCDRDVQTTLKRAWARSGLWNKSKLLASLASSAFSDEKLSAEEIEKLKQKNELEEMMAELAAFLPSVKEVLIDERDRYLAAKIFDEARSLGGTPAPDGTEPGPVLSVVGAGHLDGIVSWIGRFESGELTSSTSELEVVPQPSSLAKAAGWLIPAAIVALIAVGFLRSGTSASLELLLRWVLLNGSLAAIGSALCLAHPLTILVSFIGAPIATLNPFVGVGLFAGVTEAFVRKPRVSDFEALTEDVTSVKGFYRNRVTHILLIFFLSSFGGMIGNFIALPFLASGALAK
jgi:pheromone shutdown-related protein TraB